MKVLLAALAAAAVFGISAIADEPTSAAPPSSTPVAAVAPPPATSPPKLICHKEEVVGSTIPKRICHTKDEWEEIEKDQAADAQQLLNEKDAMSNAHMR